MERRKNWLLIGFQNILNIYVNPEKNFTRPDSRRLRMMVSLQLVLFSDKVQE
jgi:hypothetical protein